MSGSLGPEHDGSPVFGIVVAFALELAGLLAVGALAGVFLAAVYLLGGEWHS